MGEHFCVCQLKEATLVVTRRPIKTLPWWVRRLLIWVFSRYRWAASDDGQNPDDGYYATNYRGIYLNESEGRWRANEAGGSITILPINGMLPEEPCQYKCHEFPQSEFNHIYRNERRDFVTLSRQQFAMLGRKIEEVEICASGKCDTQA